MKPACRAAALILLGLLLPACSESGGGSPAAPPLPALVLGIFPLEAAVGDEIRVTGAGFGAVQGGSLLRVGGVAATVLSWSDTQIRATVPTGALGGTARVEVGGILSPASRFDLVWTVAAPQNAGMGGETNATNVPRVVPDGEGGSILAWHDFRTGTESVFAQRIDGTGAALWPAGGVLLRTSVSPNYWPCLVSDGAGGAVAAWTQGGSAVYAQRIGASGALQWGAGGVLAATASPQLDIEAAEDGAGGIIVVWRDVRAAVPDIYAQRVSAAGVPLWAAGGVPICTAAGNQILPRIVADGAGGAYVAWQDHRAGQDIYAQRIDASGAVLWTAQGLAVCSAVGAQGGPSMAPDGSGGVLIAWNDDRGFPDSGLYVQRLDGGGNALWTADGAVVCAGIAVVGEGQFVVGTGLGGALLVWKDPRAGGDTDIYAQRMSPAGAPEWTLNGVTVCAAASDQNQAQIVSDGLSSATVLWMDFRDADYQIYAQRLDDAGAPHWALDGLPLTSGAGTRSAPRARPNGFGGAVAAWLDDRGGPFVLFAQGISGSGRP